MYFSRASNFREWDEIAKLNTSKSSKSLINNADNFYIPKSHKT